MKYTEDQFYKLVESVEAEGGIHLDELCEPREYNGWVGNKEVPAEPLAFNGCGEPALFALPYDKPDKELPDGTIVEGTGMVRVCAVDDMMGLWPRYREAMA